MAHSILIPPVIPLVKIYYRMHRLRLERDNRDLSHRWYSRNYRSKLFLTSVIIASEVHVFGGHIWSGLYPPYPPQE